MNQNPSLSSSDLDTQPESCIVIMESLCQDFKAMCLYQDLGIKTGAHRFYKQLLLIMPWDKEKELDVFMKKILSKLDEFMTTDQEDDNEVLELHLMHQQLCIACEGLKEWLRETT